MLASIAIALGFSGLVGTAAAATAPANDVIAHATVVSPLPFVRTQDTTAATTDANDAQVNKTCGAPVTNNSVWYKFTEGPAATVLTVDTTGSTFSSGVIIATGTPGALTTRTCGPISAQLPVAPKTTYYILVFADSGPGGTLHLSIHGPAPAPANDTIAHAIAIKALPFHASLDTTSATTDAVDTQANQSCGAPATGNSVWYKFTPGAGDRNIFVDASASDYGAGVLVARGAPGALTTVACGPFLATATLTPGTAYYIMVFDTFDGGGGTLRLDIGDGPSIGLSVHGNASLDPHGVVHLTGTYRCTRATSLDISGELVEIVGNHVSTGLFDTLGVPAPTCNGTLQPWTGLALATTTAFAPGPVAVFTQAFACGAIVCTAVNETSVAHVVRGTAATSGTASATSIHTRTVHRVLRPRYGNAVHPATASWGR
jgi:hypothetical protein